MKQLASALVIILGLAACGGSSDTPVASPGTGTGTGTGTDPDRPPPAEGCAREIAIRCMNGVDGCDDGRTIEHVCVPLDAKAGPACELEIALVCPEGQIDGCLRSPPVSRNHVCVFN